MVTCDLVPPQLSDPKSWKSLPYGSHAVMSPVQRGTASSRKRKLLQRGVGGRSLETTVDVKTKTWPIAPDGYIPNSVIRNWWKKEKLLAQMGGCEDYFSCLLMEDADTGNEREDLTRGAFCSRCEVVEDEERRWHVTGWETGSEDEEAQGQVEERRVLPTESDEGQITVEPQRRQVSDNARKPVIYISTSCHQNEDEQKLHEHITPPHLIEQTTSRFITNTLDMMTLGPPEECPVLSVAEVLSEEESRLASCKPPVEPENLTPHPLKLPSLTPINPQPQLNRGPHHPKPPLPSPVDAQPQLDFGPHHSKPPPEEPQPNRGPHHSKPPPEEPQPNRGPHHPKPPPEEPQPNRGPHHPKPPPEEPQLNRGPHHPKPPPEEPQLNRGPHHPKPPPPNPEEPQPQPDHRPPEVSPIRDKKFLLPSAEHYIIGNQTHAPFDQKVLQFYKEYRAGTKNSLGLGKLSTITEHVLASTSSIVQANSVALKPDRRKNLHNPLYGFCCPLSVKPSNKQVREHEELELHAQITPPLQHLSEQRTYTFITNNVSSEPPEESSVLSTEEVVSKQEPWVASYILPKVTPRPLKLQSQTPVHTHPHPDLGPRHLKARPTTPEDPHPQLDLVPRHLKARPTTPEDPHPQLDLVPRHLKARPTTPEDPHPQLDLVPRHLKARPTTPEYPHPQLDLTPRHLKARPTTPEDPHPQLDLTPRHLKARPTTPEDPHPQLDLGPRHLKARPTTPEDPHPQLDLTPRHLKARPTTPEDPHPQLDLGPRHLKARPTTPEDPHPQLDLTPRHLKARPTTPEDPHPQLDLGPRHLKARPTTPEDPHPQLDLGPRHLKARPTTPEDPHPQLDLTPRHLKVIPTKPEDPQLQLEPPAFSPIKYKRLFFSSAQNNIPENQTQVPFDGKVMELYKKYKAVNKNTADLRKHSTITVRLLAPSPSTVQSNSRALKCDRRRNLHHPLPGPCFALSTRELPAKPSDGKQLATIIPLILPAEAAAYQRVVQKIRMTDAAEPPLLRFHHVVPLSAQQNFFTLNACGRTRYGRLQFDWVRRR
ncbi:glucuronokinase with putative uridyl pyrophosphorylase isoform 2-T2 [Spinachia spinachia]